ncbi:MAG: hypothetical protein ACE5FT_06915 [Candidatus Nanoarchaeia archaeon]
MDKSTLNAFEEGTKEVRLKVHTEGREGEFALQNKLREKKEKVEEELKK